METSFFEKMGGRNLLVRIASALVLLPIVLGALWWGGMPYRLLLAVAGMLMLHEWLKLTGLSGALYTILMIIVGIGALSLVVAQPSDDQVLMALGLVVFLASTLSLMGAMLRRFPLAWAGAGVVYVVIPILALSLLREAPGSALWVFWALIVVWATDIGGYFAGKGFGGPKLAPRFSPKKTWSGLVGGMVLAAGASYVVARLGDLQPLALLVIVAPVLAVLAQAGDILESAVKRHFDVKDSSNLIPGHGGMLDRVDGLILVIPAVVIFLRAVQGA